MNTAAFIRTLDGSGRGLSTAESALAYAAHGIPVFPCAAGGKRPAVAGGFHAASTNHVLVRRWWTAIPSANIGIPTGAASGLVVVDVDVHGFVDGYETLDRARAEGLVDGWTAAVRTPSDGLHLYYPAASGSEERSWQCARAGIDFRGDGGYIIVPPSSRVIDGRPRRYEVLRLASESVHGFNAERLRDFLDPPRRADQARGGD
ncbi:bifunctional DNA primase/polymerase, partial [Microbacterium maritypicum]|uniref:bifunctional DNA primase/polymerase n=2 Tax=Microbacteriaceae TaxID=85023 RepID=UPI00296E67A0